MLPLLLFRLDEILTWTVGDWVCSFLRNIISEDYSTRRRIHRFLPTMPLVDEQNPVSWDRSPFCSQTRSQQNTSSPHKHVYTHANTAARIIYNPWPNLHGCLSYQERAHHPLALQDIGQSNDSFAENTLQSTYCVAAIADSASESGPWHGLIPGVFCGWLRAETSRMLADLQARRGAAAYGMLAPKHLPTHKRSYTRTDSNTRPESGSTFCLQVCGLRRVAVASRVDAAEHKNT